MRNVFFAGLLILIASHCIADDSVATWNMPDAESQRWLERIKTLVGQEGWSVTATGNEMMIQRDKPAAMVLWAPNPPDDKDNKGQPAGDLTLRLVLRFAPPMSSDEYERLAAVNEASQREQERLRREVRVAYKFDDFAPTTPAEKQRVAAYRAAVAALPRHALPDFYTPEFSVHYTRSWHGWSAPADKVVIAEWQQIEENLVRSFGVYDPLVVAERKTVGNNLVEDEGIRNSRDRR